MSEILARHCRIVERVARHSNPRFDYDSWPCDGHECPSYKQGLKKGIRNPWCGAFSGPFGYSVLTFFFKLLRSGRQRTDIRILTRNQPVTRPTMFARPSTALQVRGGIQYCRPSVPTAWHSPKTKSSGSARPDARLFAARSTPSKKYTMAC